jgi:hypothetical protein
MTEPARSVPEVEVFDVARPSAIPAVSSRRTLFERLRDALDPYWRRVLWVIALPHASVRSKARAHSTAVVRLEGSAARRAEEIFARRLTD